MPDYAFQLFISAQRRFESDRGHGRWAWLRHLVGEHLPIVEFEVEPAASQATFNAGSSMDTVAPLYK
jgi:hypothetical protein